MGTIREALEAAATDLEGGGNADAAPADVSPPASSPGGNEGAVPGPEATERAEATGAGDEAPESAAGAAARARDGKGRFAPGGPTPPQTPALATRGGGEAKTPGGAGTGKAPVQDGAQAPPPPVATSPADKAAAPAPEALKPPTSWKPAAREEWAKLSPVVQAEVARVDREVVATMRESVEARRYAETVNRALAPHQGFIQREGNGDAVGTIASLFQTAQALRGSQKEAVVAELIRRFDCNVEKLAAHLDGKAPAASQQGPGEYRDPRVDQLLARAEAAERQRAQRQSMEAQANLEKFRGNAEFLEDVREDMALLLDSGRASTLEQAYDKACWANDEIRPILQQRKAAEAANAAQASTQRARNAAASVKGQPAGGVGGSPSSSIRGALEAAAARLNGR